MNITDKFQERDFVLDISSKISDPIIQDILNKISNSNDADTNYLTFLFRNTSYIDASSANKTSKYKLYKINSNPVLESITNEHFNIMYDKLTNIEKYYMIANAMVSKDLCHLIVNNKYILNKIMTEPFNTNPYTDDPLNLTFMNKFCHLFRYTMGYAWLTFYMEESIKRGYINKNDRFIFDIETACLLPYFPYCKKNIHICPYLPILVNRNILDIEKNILGVEQIMVDVLPDTTTRYGVTTLDTFVARLKKFVSGSVKHMDLLDNINWSNLAVTGSVMACCLPNFNPLLTKFITEKKGNYEIYFTQFANEYYAKADIDIICNILDTFDFVDKINEFKETIEHNIKISYQIKKPEIEVTKLYSNKTVAVLINKYFIQAHLSTSGMTYGEVLSNLKSDKIKKWIYSYYSKWHEQYLIKSLSKCPEKFLNPKYMDLFIPVDIEHMNIILIKSINQTSTDNDSEEMFVQEDKTEEIECKMLEELTMSANEVFEPKTNYKFRISSEYLPHCFELFQGKYDDFFSTIAKFHLPIVRSYYDGTTVKLTPSCISACMTMLNIDYKYFSSANDPIEILNKYRRRGFGTICSSNEISRLIKYSSMVTKWQELYNLNIKSSNSVVAILGQLPVKHALFQPQEKHENTFISIPVKQPLNILSDIIKQINKLYKHPQSAASVELQFGTQNINNPTLMLTTINKSGYVQPVKKWVFHAFLDNTFDFEN
jgi:hypothetical protein